MEILAAMVHEFYLQGRAGELCWTGRPQWGIPGLRGHEVQGPRGVFWRFVYQNYIKTLTVLYHTKLSKLDAVFNDLKDGNG